MKCPKHIENNVVKLPNHNVYVAHDCDEYHLPYLVKCSCGCEKFEILTNPEPMVLAKCNECGKEITVYNLRDYPAAALIPYNGDVVTYISPEGDSIFNVCVVYEYPELEEDEEFDPNDISWCQIYGLGTESKKVFQIISDETA